MILEIILPSLLVGDMVVSEEAILDRSVLVPTDLNLPTRVVPAPKLLSSTVNTSLGGLLDPLGELGLGDEGVVVPIDLVHHQAELDPCLLWGQAGKVFGFVPQESFVVVFSVVFSFYTN